jgi:hypothetical protein
MDLSPADQPFYCDWVQLKHSADAAILTNVNAEFGIDGNGDFYLKDINFGRATAFDSQMFEVSAGTFKYKELLVEKLKGTVASFGGPGQAGLVAIFNSAGALIGWDGDDRQARPGYAGTGSGFEGGWRKRFLVGGSSPATAKLVADTDGNVAMEGVFVCTANSLTTSINNTIDSLGYYAGVSVKNTNDSARVTLSPSHLTLVDANNYRRATFEYDRMRMYRAPSVVGVEITHTTSQMDMYTAAGASAVILEPNTLSANGGNVPGMITIGDVRFQALRARTYNSYNLPGLSTPANYLKSLNLYDSNGNYIGLIPIF